MPIDYDRMAEVCTRLLQPAPCGNGMAIALRRVTPGTFNAATGKTTGAATADLPTVGVWVSQTADYQVTGRGVGGVARIDDVLSADRTMVMDGSVEPLLTDHIIIAGDPHPWQILSIQIIAPTTVPIAYRCVVRK